METVRRPEVVKLAATLQAKNPSWSYERCLVEAKVLVTQPIRKS